jgi:hypothetical protein
VHLQHFVLRDGIPEQLPGPARAYAINDRGEVLGWEAFPARGVLWKNGQRIAISGDTYDETYTGEFGWLPTSLSRTKGLLGGFGDRCNPYVGCSGESNFRGYVWIAYPRDQVVP